VVNQSERKSATDFAQSLIGGRLFSQARQMAESARLIFYIGSQLARLRDPEHVPYRQGKAKRKKSRQLRLLQGLPGVGPDRAKQLLERFKTVRACFSASTSELIKVEGIGPKTAAAIDHVIN
jgi:ERCC4-type nuclease